MLLAYLAFAIGVASPGPSVLAVMGMAMARGRARALMLASGVVSGSLFWGLCAAMHLTNPKAVVVWLSVVSLALPPGAAAADALVFVASCVPLSAAIFTAYALAFSTAPARRAYRAGERGINAVLAGVFGYAGVRMLLSTSITTRT